MNLNDFLRLVPIFSTDSIPVSEGYRHHIPLMDFIEVLEKNNLIIVSKYEWQRMGIEELKRRTVIHDCSNQNTTEEGN